MKCFEAPETNKTTSRSISEPVEEWILASWWILNMLISNLETGRLLTAAHRYTCVAVYVYALLCIHMYKLNRLSEIM